VGKSHIDKVVQFMVRSIVLSHWLAKEELLARKNLLENILACKRPRI